MFDLVWLGNYIVPRWEAIFALGLVAIMSLLATGFFLVVIGYTINLIWKCKRYTL